MDAGSSTGRLGVGFSPRPWTGVFDDGCPRAEAKMAFAARLDAGAASAGLCMAFVTCLDRRISSSSRMANSLRFQLGKLFNVEYLSHGLLGMIPHRVSDESQPTPLMSVGLCGFKVSLGCSFDFGIFRIPEPLATG